MRVCHVWHNFPPIQMGGVERYILELSNFLGDQNSAFQFSLITDKTEQPLLKSRKIPKYEKMGHLEVNRFGPNLLSVTKGVYYKLFHSSTVWLDQQITKKLCDEMANIRNVAESDIFHVHGLWGTQYPALGAWLSTHFNKPLVVSLHGDAVGTEFFYSMPLEKKEFTTILRQASAVTTYSKKVLGNLEKMGLSNKSHLIPNFINTKDFKRPIAQQPERGTRVVMICRLDPFKDPLTAIQAFAQVVKKEPKATLQIVGDGPLYGSVKALIEELHLEKAVFLMGKHSDVRPFLWENDIFLTGNAFLSILEAWSAGLAVVAANEETTGKLITDGKDGVLVPPRDPQKLAEALLMLMANSDYRLALAQSGVQTASLYDVSKSAKQICSVYQSIMQSSG